MHYFALLISPERELTPDEGTAEMTAYMEFHAKAAAAILAGDALQPSADRSSDHAAARTRRPSPTARSPRARRSQAATTSSKRTTSTTHWNSPVTSPRPSTVASRCGRWCTSRPRRAPLTSDSWLALLLEPPGSVVEPGSPQWDEGIKAHVEFGKLAGDRAVGGAPLHPPTTATTVRVRDGEVLLTDGPYIEGAEVANGFYYINAADRDEAVKVASMIPATTVELRRLSGVSGL